MFQRFWLVNCKSLLKLILPIPPLQVQSLGLPVSSPRPYRIEGVRLTIQLLPNSVIKEGEVKIIFAVKNPSTIPNDNVWTLTGLAGDQVEFLELVPSYSFGQVCTEDTVGGIGGSAGGASRKFVISEVFGLIGIVGLFWWGMWECSDG